MTSRRPDDFSVVAIIAAHNEGDVIAQCVRALITEGIGVYVIDDSSTDGTVAEVEPFVGRGVLGIERFAGGAPGEYDWTGLLRRKEQLAAELDADWFIHHDADEFRESPWAGITLRDAIQIVERAGFNAIDFALLDFQPTHNRFRRGDDPRKAFPYYEPGADLNKVQIRCWKKTASGVTLAHGGHDAVFDGRRVFPVRFLLRHYPVRSQAHGQRKILQERRPRFREAELALGWHRQYEGATAETSFIREPATLREYDGVSVRHELHLSALATDELHARMAALGATIDGLRSTIDRLRSTNDELRSSLEPLHATVEHLQRQISAWRARAEAAEDHIRNLEQTRSWQWTAPLRLISSWARGVRR